MKLERVERLNLTLSAGAVAATFAFASPHVAWSLAVGAALEAMNFGALVRGARIYLGGGEQSSGPWLALFSVRFVLLGVGIVLVMQAGAHPVALVCGLSIAIPTVVIDGWLNRPKFDPDAASDWIVPPPDDESWDRYSIWRPQALDEAEEESNASALNEPTALDKDASALKEPTAPDKDATELSQPTAPNEKMTGDRQRDPKGR